MLAKGMRIEFVNHASFITHSEGVSLLCDPWLSGTAFNDGWDLLCPGVFGLEDFARVTHLWFSHEHPDHFAPANLRQIPEPHRRRISVLFQTTVDRKVIDYCRKLGFGEVRELPQQEWIELAPGFRVLCGTYGTSDSWLAIDARGTKLLNLNDCLIWTAEQAGPIRERVGPIDVLATQFSLSAWEGNPDEVERRKHGARTMLDRAVFHARFFAPRYCIPFASFVWFCHEENFYMNAQHNRIDRVAHALASGTGAQPIVMYPGDTFRVGEPYDSQTAIDRYVADFEAVNTRQRITAKPVAERDLIEAANAFCKKLGERAGKRRLARGLARSYARRAIASWPTRPQLQELGRIGRAMVSLRPPPARIWVTDHAKAYGFDLIDGLRPLKLPRAACDIILGADSLAYGFRFLWGGESLLVNGRFAENYPGAREALLDYFYLAEYFNRGHDVRAKTRIGRLLDAVRQRAGSARVDGPRQ